MYKFFIYNVASSFSSFAMRYMSVVAPNRNIDGKFIPKNINLKIFFRNISTLGVNNNKDSSEVVENKMRSEVVDKNKFILYRELKTMINSSPINYDTQLAIENFLYEYDTANLNDRKFSNIYEFLGSVNKEFKDIFFHSRMNLLALVTNFKRQWLNFEFRGKNLKQKEITFYNLGLILDELSDNLILNIILGKFITIINTPKQKDLSCEKFFNDMGQHLIECYYYKLYEEKKKIMKQLDINKYYSLYDWRDENKDILDKYNDTQLVHSMGSILIDWLRDVYLVEFDFVRSLDDDNKRNLNIIKLSKRLEAIIKDIKLPLNLPSNLPMLIKPKKCYKMKNKNGIMREHLGGYL